MNTRRPLLVWLLMLLWLPLGAVAQDYQEGEDYRVLSRPVPTSTEGTDKVEVVEVFWYGCPHCYSLEPVLEEWLKNKPENIEYVRLPGVLNSNWELGARAFYVAKALDVLDEIHRPLFDAIHQERRPMRTKEDLKAFFVDQGIAAEDFERAYNSFQVATQLNRAKKQVRDYGVYGVPTLIVAGKYETSPSMVGSRGKVMDVVEYLVKKEAEGS